MWFTMIDILRKYWKQASVLILLGAMFAGGWKANTVYNGYQQNLLQQTKDQVDKALRDVQREHAKNLIEVKELLANRETEVIKVDVPKIIEKKVYYNLCLEEEGVKKLQYEKDLARKLRGL